MEGVNERISLHFEELDMRQCLSAVLRPGAALVLERINVRRSFIRVPNTYRVRI